MNNRDGKINDRLNINNVKVVNTKNALWFNFTWTFPAKNQIPLKCSQVNRFNDNDYETIKKMHWFVWDQNNASLDIDQPD